MTETIHQPVGLRWEEWQHTKSLYKDTIRIDKLQITTDVLPDAFGRRKQQPAYISVCLTLQQNLESVAEIDRLDATTINYGTLSKAILQKLEEKAAAKDLNTVSQLWTIIENIVPNTVVEAVETDILFPKACRSGDGLGFKRAISTNAKDALMVYFQNLRVQSLIGINDHERLSKQPVVVNAWIDDPAKQIRADDSIQDWETMIAKVMLRAL
jgi:dihydroneopterin aldolase